MAAMEYLSQRDVDALAAAKRLDARLEVRTTRVQHRRVEERKQNVYLWLKLAVLAAALVAAWVYARYRAMRLLYPAEVEWFSERYTLGPRPAGAENYSLDCLLVSAEYPAFAHAFRSQACGSLPQTSAIFLLTMLQMFGDKMEGVHYSGDRAQLRGAKVGEFVKTFSAWNVPDNPWRFLFPTPSKFARSPAVQKARSSPNGDTMLSSLFNGGLCAVATQFYDPDVDASQMCRELLDEELVYFQSCAATKASRAMSTGSDVATAVSIVVGMVFTGIGCGVMAFFTGGTALGLCAPALAEEGSAAAALATVATTSYVSTVSAPVAFAATAAASAAAGAAAAGISYSVACPFSQHYVLVRQPDGSYKKEAWHGDVADLPPRLKPGGEGGNEKAHHATK